jgi:hypothetical protein
MNELKGCTKDQSWSRFMDQSMPTFLYSILFYFSLFYSVLLHFWKCDSNNFKNNNPFEAISLFCTSNESVRTCKGFKLNYVAKYTRLLKCNNYLAGCHTATTWMFPALSLSLSHARTHTPFLSLNAIYGNIRNFIDTNKCRKCSTTCTVLSSGNYNITSYSHNMYHFS